MKLVREERWIVSRRAITLVTCLLVAAFASPAQAASYGSAGDDGARIVSESPVATPSPGVTGVQLTISTTAFTAPTRVQVFLPAGYYTEPKRRWPVTYYLHGAAGDDTRFNAWYGGLIGRFPSIVVAPSGGALGFYSDWYNNGAGGPPEYQTYDIDQLIPLIDATFRTIASRQGRALIGESMGGYGVMSYAALYPDLFAAAVSMSGAVDTSYLLAVPVITISPLVTGEALDAIYGPRATQEVRWRGHNPVDLAGNLGGVALRVTTADGTPAGPEGPALVGGELADCLVENAIHQMNLDLERQLNASGIPHEWVDYGAGCHTIWNFQRQFAAALPMLEDVFAHPRPNPPVVSYRSIEPSFTAWGWQIIADPNRALEFLQMINAGANGLTLTGSGTTNVVTPPFFRGLRVVDLITTDGTRTVAPDGAGRLRFTVDLGPPHRNQEYTVNAGLAGEKAPTYFTTRTVTFAPHARLILNRVRLTAAGARACIRAIGASVPRAQISLETSNGRSIIGHRLFGVTDRTSCVHLSSRKRLRPGGYTVSVTGVDRFGHRAAASRHVRLTPASAHRLRRGRARTPTGEARGRVAGNRRSRLRVRG
jgi:S-formylglutathione hydrolase FrmB